MDIRKIRKLIELVESSDISKLEIYEGKKAIRIIKSNLQKSSVIASVPTKKETQNLFKTLKEQDYNQLSNEKIDENTICSPMVGIFYRAANPNETPFISKGQFVDIGDTLCIIEAMKVMNHIQSDKVGIIHDILVNDGQPVEFGEPLLIIKKQE